MGPPADLSAERLFRLLASPSPSLPLSTRLGDGFTVCAIPSRLVLEAEPDSRAAATVAAALQYEDGSPVFPLGASDVEQLPVTDFDELAGAVDAALARCSPWRHACDVEAWHARLCEGAKALSNMHAAHLLGVSYDVVEYGKYVRFVPRPDRFFGVGLGSLLDGHVMAYRAARAVYEEAQPK